MSGLIDKLADEITACSRCPLRATCSQPVPGTGLPDATYLLLGEAPGAEEDRMGVPFVGLAGKRLDKLINLSKIDINDCYFTNVVKCRPPRNRDPRKKEILACRPWLEQEIKLIKPTYIVALGRIPTSLFSPYGIKQLHGTMATHDFGDVDGLRWYSERGRAASEG